MYFFNGYFWDECSVSDSGVSGGTKMNKIEHEEQDFFLHKAYSLALVAQPVQNLAENVKSLDQRGCGSTVLQYTIRDL